MIGLEHFSDKFVNTEFRHSTHHKIDYSVYVGTSASMSAYHTAKEHKEIVDTACFGSLSPHAHMETCPFKTSVFIVYEAVQETDKPTKSYPVLTDSEGRAWTELCRRNKLLPRTARWLAGSRENPGRQKIILNLSTTYMSLAYFYLTMCRYFREDPGIVRATVYLVNTKKIDPFIALVIAHQVCTDYASHSVLPCVRGYFSPERLCVDLSAAASVYEFVTHPSEYCKKRFYTSSYADPELHDTLTGMSVEPPVRVGIEIATSSLAKEFVYSENRETLAEELNKRENEYKKGRN